MADPSKDKPLTEIEQVKVLLMMLLILTPIVYAAAWVKLHWDELPDINKYIDLSSLLDRGQATLPTKLPEQPRQRLYHHLQLLVTLQP